MSSHQIMQTVCAVVVHFFSYCIDNEIECLPIVSMEAGNNSEYPYSAHLAIKGLPALGRYTLHVSKAQRLGVSIFQMNACTIFQCVRTEGTHNTHTAISFFVNPTSTPKNFHQPPIAFDGSFGLD